MAIQDNLDKEQKWVFVGEATGGDMQLQLPLDFEENKAEIFINVALDNNVVYVIPIQIVHVVYVSRVYRSGFYANNATNGMAAVRITEDGKIYLYSAYLNGNDVKNSTKIYVRYKKH